MSNNTTGNYSYDNRQRRPEQSIRNFIERGSPLLQATNFNENNSPRLLLLSPPPPSDNSLSSQCDSLLPFLPNDSLPTASPISLRFNRPVNTHENIGSPLPQHLLRSRRISNFNNITITSNHINNILENESEVDSDSDYDYDESNHEAFFDIPQDENIYSYNLINTSQFLHLSITELEILKKNLLHDLNLTENLNQEANYITSIINLIDQHITSRHLEEDLDIFKPVNGSKNMFKNYKQNNCDSDLTQLNKKNLDYLNKHCNDCQGLYGDYTNEDINELITIKILNSENKYEKGICFTKSEFKDYIKSSYNDDNPSNIQAIYTKPLNPQKLEDYVSGMTSKATGRIIIKIPTGFSPFITLKSAYQILNNNNRIWYALPLFGGKKRRIGSIQSKIIVSGNHGQTPGYIIYKLYTKEEIKKGIKVEEKDSDYPISLFVYEPMKQLDFILGLDLNPEQIYKKFINGIINYLIDN
jgi:hypothetical protein